MALKVRYKTILACLVCLFGFTGLGIAQAVTPDGYRITIGDELELDILDDSDPPQRFVVGGNGQIQLPFVGGVKVEGVTVGEARQLIASVYVEREIFVAPTVELSISEFRPVFVLGDVRTPGKYDFQPFLTAEQAVGLAGGSVVSGNSEEARILERRNLEGTLAGVDADLSRIAAQYARVQALLNGRPELNWDDVPADLREVIDRSTFDALKPNEDEIIALDVQNRETRRKLIEDAAKEAESRVALIDQRAEVLGASLDSAREELVRAKDLMDRGLTTQNALNEAEKTVARQENEILILGEQRSAALVQLNDLKSQLSQIQTEWEKGLISEGQGYRSEIEKLMTQRASIEDRLMLLQQWMAAGAGALADLPVTYTVQRRTESGVDTLTLAGSDELSPGDQLLVTVTAPETPVEGDADQ